MREIVFRLAPGLRLDGGEIVVHFGVAHRDLLVYFALAQPLHQDFVAHVFAVLAVGNIVLGQCLMQPIERQLVVLGNPLNRAVDHRVIDLDAVFLRELHQRTLGDQAFEHLLVEDIGARLLHLLLLQLLQDDAFGVVELVLRDGLVIDHGNDAVQRNGALWRRCPCRRRVLRRGNRVGQGKHCKNKIRTDMFRIPGSIGPPRRRWVVSLDRCRSDSRARCA